MIEALKLGFDVLIRYRSSENGLRQTLRRTVLWDASGDFEEQPLHGMDSQECEETAVPAREVVGREPTGALPTAPLWLTVVSASIVWASTTYIVCLLFNRSGKRLTSTSHSFPLPCFISTLLLCTSPAQFQPPSSCTAFTRLQGVVSPWRSRKVLFFRSVLVFRLFPLLFLIITISFLAFCSPRQPCHALHTHSLLLHSSCSPSSLPAPVTSSSSIMYLLLPLARIGTDGACRSIIIIMQQP